jgi:2-polyprenyl-3-methyl-5-hydroxy-6-metoxy-1,4-benzoquinol methylase
MNPREGPTRQDEWEQRYRDEPVEEMPWYLPELDFDFKAAFEKMGIVSGKILDICTGPGTQALALAKMGFEVTATDISETAVKKADKLAREEGLDIRFVQNDILNSTLKETFDYVYDRGCFHTFDPEMRSAYTETVSGILRLGGILFLKCFSTKEKGEEGPHRISREIIEENFSEQFDIVSIEHTRFQGNKKPKALFCIMRKV